MKPEFTSWRKSSYSDPDGKCVEVGRGSGGSIGVRDTKEQGIGPRELQDGADTLLFCVTDSDAATRSTAHFDALAIGVAVA